MVSGEWMGRWAVAAAFAADLAHFIQLVHNLVVLEEDERLADTPFVLIDA